MPYPPTLPPNNRTNTTPNFDNHPNDHNNIVKALADIIAELGNDPSGAFADLTARMAATTPVGSVLIYSAAAAPTNWLLCNGAPVLRATWPALWNLIGSTYGAGDGTTTFNTPNLIGRFPVALDATDGLLNALAKTGGSKNAVIVDHTHAIDPPAANAVVPAHDHGPGAGTEFFNRQPGGGAAGATVTNLGEQWFGPNKTGQQPATNAPVDIPPFTSAGVTPAQGPVPNALNYNMPPFIVLNFIIKAA